jgi:hypothetical protein
MKEVNQISGYVTNVTITEDRVSAQKVHEERMATYRTKSPDIDF